MSGPGANPLVVVVAGPNGAGKSTAAPRLLRDTLHVDEFVNADVIAAGLSAFRPEGAAVAAGRIMLARMNELAAAGRSFAFETTLASRSFAPWLGRLGMRGYRTHLLFLWLESADLAVSRVAERASVGGHDVPEATIRRRYESGLENLFALYQPIVDSWQLFDNSRGPRPKPVDARESSLSPHALVDDLARIEEALALAVADALRMHKRAGNPIATWRNGRVEWIQPEDIVVPGDE